MSRQQPEWMRRVKVGSVLRARSGLLRVVRTASFYPCGQLSGVSFTIKHCSWTKCALTFYGYTDLKGNGYELVEGVTVKLGTALDQKIAHDARHSRKDRLLDCCDVRGIA